MKKRIFALLLAVFLPLCAASCGEADNPTDTTAEKQPDSELNYENPNDLEIDFKY